MPNRILITLVFLGLTIVVGCSLDKKERVAQGGMDEERALKAESAKPAPPAKIMPDTHIAAGKMLERQGDLTGAIVQYERAIAIEPRSATAYNRLGVVYQKLGRHTDAELIFKQGAAADPASAVLPNNLGYCYLSQLRYAEAEQAFRDALLRSPDFQRARMNLAIVMAQTGRLEESLIEFSRVVPADVAHYNVAMISLQRRDYASAEKSLREALAINPSSTGAQDQLRRVEQLAARPTPRSPTRAEAPLTGPVAGALNESSNTESP